MTEIQEDVETAYESSKKVEKKGKIILNFLFFIHAYGYFSYILVSFSIVSGVWNNIEHYFLPLAFVKLLVFMVAHLGTVRMLFRNSRKISESDEANQYAMRSIKEYCLYFLLYYGTFLLKYALIIAHFVPDCRRMELFVYIFAPLCIPQILIAMYLLMEHTMFNKAELSVKPTSFTREIVFEPFVLFLFRIVLIYGAVGVFIIISGKFQGGEIGLRIGQLGMLFLLDIGSSVLMLIVYIIIIIRTAKTDPENSVNVFEEIRRKSPKEKFPANPDIAGVWSFVYRDNADNYLLEMGEDWLQRLSDKLFTEPWELNNRNLIIEADGVHWSKSKSKSIARQHSATIIKLNTDYEEPAKEEDLIGRLVRLKCISFLEENKLVILRSEKIRGRIFREEIFVENGMLYYVYERNNVKCTIVYERKILQPLND